jgi:hypothetical protein
MNYRLLQIDISDKVRTNLKIIFQSWFKKKGSVSKNEDYN